MILVAGLMALPASSQLAFFEVTDLRGLGSYPMSRGMGSGVAAADFDGDGDVDLFLPTAQDSANRVYRNRGDGHFDEVGALLGLDSLESSRSGLWFDADGDGDLDLVVAGDYWPTDPPPGGGTSKLRLYLQQMDGTFVHSELSGIGDLLTRGNQHRGGLAAGDLDADGDLDLVLAALNGLVWFENA